MLYVLMSLHSQEHDLFLSCFHLLEILCPTPNAATAKSIIRGDACWQFKKAVEPVEFGLAEQFELFPSISAADSCADGYNKNVNELVTLGAINSWISNTAKNAR